MRDLVLLTTWLVLGFSLTAGLAAGMEEWQLARHRVDEAVDVQSGLLAAVPVGFATKVVSAK
jgi:hypothetical protein